MRSFVFACSLNLILAAVASAADGGKKPYFEFDKPNVTIKTEQIDGAMSYQADVAVDGKHTWLTWLKFERGKGDRIRVDRRGGKPWKWTGPPESEPAELKEPTLTLSGGKTPWLSYERGNEKHRWQILLRPPAADPPFGNEIAISEGPGNAISHRVAADGRGGVWVAWQDERNGQWDVLARNVTAQGTGPIEVVSSNPAGDWRPDVTVDARGGVHVVWDAYDGESFNVRLRSRSPEGNWGEAYDLTEGDAFQGRARVTALDGQLWVVWEEGAPHWGKEYRARRGRGGKEYHEMSDTIGPLHRYRGLRLAQIAPEKLPAFTLHEIPMPSRQRALARPEVHPDVMEMGAFYERAEIATDGRGRIWLSWRHYYTPWMGYLANHHIENGWGVYARALEPEGGWSPLYRFSTSQGDGMQRLAIDSNETGIAAVWSEGRTDRRDPKSAGGIALAAPAFRPDARGRKARPARTTEKTAVRPETRHKVRERFRERVDAFAKSTGMNLYFGDLHRHTDLSLCFVPSDGTIDDAYRYATEVAGLDFLGITDHTRDIAFGDPLSLLWWRCLKEVDRHTLAGEFVPFYSFERSRGDTDHNVISLRRDVLHPHDYPLPDYWNRIDGDTITIPHQPFNSKLWRARNDERRPLLEIYQGFRDFSTESDAREGLQGGHRFGIIASSDHLSTSASYACVWAEEPTREAIFAAMKSRRTYGATARILMYVQAGEHWMGERIDADEWPEIRVIADGTDTIEKVDFMIDGEVAETIGPNSRTVDLTHRPNRPEGAKSIYVRITQTDGNRAWSSPIFIGAAQ